MKENRKREKRLSMEDIDIPTKGSKEEKHTCILKSANSIPSENSSGNAIADDFGRIE